MKRKIQLFVRKPDVVEAYRWFKNGDHPKDDCKILIDNESGEQFLGEGKVVRYFRHSGVSGESLCGFEHCKMPMHDHGCLENDEIVCPGDWILEKDGEYSRMSDWIFRDTYMEPNR